MSNRVENRHLEVGQQGERVAREFLTGKGFRIADQNWRFKNHKEVDLIATAPNRQLVAVEVRSHHTPQEYEPFESIQPSKVRRLKQALAIYAEQNLDQSPAMRIDVVSVVLEPRKIEHFESVDLYLS